MMNEINSDISELKKYSSDEVTQSIVSHLLYQTELLRGVNLDIKVLSDMYTEIKIISNIDSLSKYQLIVNYPLNLKLFYQLTGYSLLEVESLDKYKYHLEMNPNK